MRNRLVQIALSLALLVLLIQIVLIAPGQVRDQDEAALLPAAPQKASEAAVPQDAAENGVDQSMKGMHMIETQEGAKDWELWADRAISIKAKDLLELEKVKALFFSENGVTFTVTGSKGQVQVKDKSLWVEGDVITRSSNGYVFRTERVAYDSKARQLYAPSTSKCWGPKMAMDFR